MRLTGHRRFRIAAPAIVSCLALVVGSVFAPVAAGSTGGGSGGDRGHGNSRDKVLMFAADGMRQDLIEQYAGERRTVVPGFAEMLRTGAKAGGNGMLTQAPPNTGAGWYTMATGAWPAVHGSTNNTFFVDNQPMANRTAAFDQTISTDPGAPSVLQAETIAQAAERGHKKVIQTGMGRRGQRHDQRPHGRLPQLLLGARGRHQLPQRRRGTRPRGDVLGAVRRGHPRAGDRLDERAHLLQPRPGDPDAGAGRNHRQVRPERLRLDSSNDHRVDYDKVLFARERTAAPRWPTCARENWPTSRSRSRAAPSTAGPAACWSRSRRLDRRRRRRSGSSTPR